MKGCAKDLSHDRSTDVGKKPTKYPEVEQPNPTKQEWNRRPEEHEKECNEQNLSE